VQLPDPRGGSALARAEATSAFDALRLRTRHGGSRDSAR
jgi:hypothetical protein